MSEPGTRVASWLGFVSDLLVEHVHEVPHQLILEQLTDTFDGTGVGYSSTGASGTQQLISWPSGLLDPVTDLNEWLGERSQKHHPLMRWHAATCDPGPTTIARVPTALVPKRMRAPIIETLRTHGLEQQVAINVRLGGLVHQTYIVARTRSDFTDDDLVVARYARRALLGLDRQVSLIQQFVRRAPHVFDVGLTGREAAVLSLLAAGYSTRAIAARLNCSPRTVEKHVERVFRKLGVRDRINALRVARAWGLA